MRIQKFSYSNSTLLLTKERPTCLRCDAPLHPLNFVTGRKTIQLMSEVLKVAYRPHVCTEKGYLGKGLALASPIWPALAPKYSTYGDDVMTHIGWERQYGHAPFASIQARRSGPVQIRESMIRYVYPQKYLPLLASDERPQWPRVRELAETRGLILSLDGWMPEGGEPQLWLIRELQSGCTLRCGWLSNQDEATCVAFLQPIADHGLTVKAVMSDKQRGLLPAIAHVFSGARHVCCQAHDLRNVARPVAERDEQMKIELRHAVRAAVGDLIWQKDPEKPVELTVTGLIPSSLPSPVDPTRTARETIRHEHEQVVHDLLHRVRDLLTLKGRPPFRLAGQEMFMGLHDVGQRLTQLLRHRPDPRLMALRTGIQNALQSVRPTDREVSVATQWLNALAARLNPAPSTRPATGATVRAEWEAVLAEIAQANSRSDPLAALGAHMAKVSASDAPGLFWSDDLPGAPRTNNACESDFRQLRSRLLSTTGQQGAVARLLLREGAWELIPRPASRAETCRAIAQVDSADMHEEERRVHQHRAGFRLHTRSAKHARAQLQHLTRRWMALPAKGIPSEFCGTAYFDYFGPTAGRIGQGYYSYDLGAWHLVVLNSQCWQVGGCEAGSPQERWLRTDLAAHLRRCLLAYWHQPLFTSGTHGNLAPTRAFWDDLYAAGADVVLNAHDHHCERFVPQDPAGRFDPARGLREFGVGTGGRSLPHFTDQVQPNSEARDADTDGVLKLTRWPDRYAWAFLPASGGTFHDVGGAPCH